MIDEINKDFEEFQKFLEKKNMRLKPFFRFEKNNDLLNILSEVNSKQIKL